VYSPDLIWNGLLIFSSVVLLVTGCFGIIVSFLTNAPDIFDPVISQTYDNPHMRLPAGGSTLDTIDRSRLLRDVEVRVGDINCDQDVGKLVFAVAGDVQPLVIGKSYF
jgi:hypothetical protein